MRPFEEARVFAHELGLNSKNEWIAWAKGNARPSDIPVDPRQVYKENGWIDWGDWLGTNRIATFNKEYQSFQEARAFVHSLGLKSQTDWTGWAQSGARPNDIPSTPQGVYKGKGWVGWGDWLGTGRVANFNKVQRPFQEAREFVRSLGLKRQTEWRKWSQTEVRPSDIPAYPEGVYKNDGWKDWGDWLGTDRVAPQNMQYLPFQEARAFVCALQLSNSSEWKVWAKSGARPANIPASPSGVYKSKGWVSWGDWLGTGRVAYQNMAYRPFDEARSFVRGLGPKSKEDWKVWAKSNARPENIPTDPQSGYKNKGWTSWSDWLGTRNKKTGFRSYEESRVFVQTLQLQNQSEWRAWAKSTARPDDIPADPQGTYRGKGWINWGDWLGTRNQKGGYLSFDEARSIAR